MIRKMIISAVGAGIVYLMKNKEARHNLMDKAQRLTRSIKQSQV